MSTAERASEASCVEQMISASGQANGPVPYASNYLSFLPQARPFHLTMHVLKGECAADQRSRDVSHQQKACRQVRSQSVLLEKNWLMTEQILANNAAWWCIQYHELQSFLRIIMKSSSNVSRYVKHTCLNNCESISFLLQSPWLLPSNWGRNYVRRSSHSSHPKNHRTRWTHEHVRSI